jgi:CHAT domain-containing protein
MCGDNDLEPFIDADFTELCGVGSLPDIHLVVQRDRREGARRYLFPEGRCDAEPVCDATLDNVRVNTGEPSEAVKFLLWGLEHAPSEHVAVIFAGLGISPSYVRQRLLLSSEATTEQAIDTQVQQELFSICHDVTSHDALEAHELRQVLERVKEKLNTNGAPERLIDLVGLDMGAAAFVEIAYQMEGLAEVLVASQRLLPDDGWPYDQILSTWQQRIVAGQAEAREIGRLIVDTVANTYTPQDVRMVAVNLGALDDTGRMLDTLALALMQSLGDWHVLQAVRCAMGKTDWISAELPTAASSTASLLPAVDMLELLEQLRLALADEARQAPEVFGQRQRLMHLQGLIDKALQALMPDSQAHSRLILHAQPTPQRGLSILVPPVHTAFVPDEELTMPAFSLAHSNYLNLEFSQHVHWAALIGAFELIVEKPYALWRLISAMLADSSGVTRDAILRHLISPDSVIEGLKQQFQSLSSGTALTLSLEPQEPSVAPGTTGGYLLRLESSVPGATVAEHESRVYQSSMEMALQGLEQLLNSAEDNPHVLRDLEALGRTLGEDVIQDLAERLQTERTATVSGQADGAIHLRLQMPRALMRYPWELLHDRQGLLCERFALGRQVFMEVPLMRRVLRRKPGPVEILIIGDPQLDLERYQQEYKWRPQQLPGARGEAQTVVNAFAQLHEELAGLPPLHITALIGTEVTVHEFRRLLRSGQFDIIHYASHACFDKKDPEGSAWLLSNGLLRAREIRNTLSWTVSPPWLVFANACEAGMDAGAPVGQYQSDVFGLATAFINQGVAAYIAPLWPIDDAVAAQLASDFYRTLLLERTSLGEALRLAKTMAKQALLGPSSDNTEWLMPPRVALSWASVVLYGDPTPRLLESLWTPYAEHDVTPPTPPVPTLPAQRRRTARRQVRRLRQATAEETSRLVSGPGMVPVSSTARSGQASVLLTPGVELLEINGIRVWYIIDPHTGQRHPLPGSTLAAAASRDTVRGVLGLQRGWTDYVRVIGSWVVGEVMGTEDKPLLTRLVEQYDKEMVASEQLLLITPDARLEPLPHSGASWGWLETPLRVGQEDRVLLIIHGTFSKTAMPVSGLGEEFLNWARQAYRGVIGFDHWTLSKTPEDNARDLWERLDPRLRTGNRLDLITHSRGGLVARALIELLGHGEAVRRVAFVGTPNAGTNLANPQNWGRAADMLVNLAHLDPLGWYGRLSGFLVSLLARGAVGDIPGLQAQDPTATGQRQFLGRLQTLQTLHEGVTYLAVAANYEPEHDEFNVKRALIEAGDTALDGLFPGPNDLVVDTAHVWATDAAPTLAATGSVIPAERLLLFNPDSQVTLPPGIQLQRANGVHHTNLFGRTETRDFLRQQLA